MAAQEQAPPMMRPAPSAKRPAKKQAGSGQPVPQVMRQGPIVPWLYLGPALVVMTTFIIYPGLNTLYLSFRSSDGSNWASAACQAGQACWGILENYRYALTSEVMRTAFINNLTWIVLMVSGTVLLGLTIATLADRVRYEPLAKAIIFLPMAISFVGAGVIWKFVYDFRPGEEQVGLLNALVGALGLPPVSWLTTPVVNNLALILVGVWMWTGFCMTILAAALKGVPIEMLEAASVDGATEWQAFWGITIPQILPTVTVVITTMIINVLKIFDIPYVMTGGNFGTEVIANRMYSEQYQTFQTGRAAAIAVVLVAVIIPAMILNVRRNRAEEAAR